MFGLDQCMCRAIRASTSTLVGRTLDRLQQVSWVEQLQVTNSRGDCWCGQKSSAEQAGMRRKAGTPSICGSSCGLLSLIERMVGAVAANLAVVGSAKLVLGHLLFGYNICGAV